MSPRINNKISGDTTCVCGYTGCSCGYTTLTAVFVDIQYVSLDTQMIVIVEFVTYHIHSLSSPQNQSEINCVYLSLKYLNSYCMINKNRISEYINFE